MNKIAKSLLLALVIAAPAAISLSNVKAEALTPYQRHEIRRDHRLERHEIRRDRRFDRHEIRHDRRFDRRHDRFHH